MVNSNKYDRGFYIYFEGNGRENIECDHAQHVKEGRDPYWR